MKLGFLLRPLKRLEKSLNDWIGQREDWWVNWYWPEKRWTCGWEPPLVSWVWSGSVGVEAAWTAWCPASVGTGTSWGPSWRGSPGGRRGRRTTGRRRGEGGRGGESSRILESSLWSDNCNLTRGDCTSCWLTRLAGFPSLVCGLTRASLSAGRPPSDWQESHHQADNVISQMYWEWDCWVVITDYVKCDEPGVMLCDCWARLPGGGASAHSATTRHLTRGKLRHTELDPARSHWHHRSRLHLSLGNKSFNVCESCMERMM